MSETDASLGCKDCDWAGGLGEYALVDGRAVCPRCKGQLEHTKY
jgi:uncharacterized paraquat-inducible protein A